MLSKFAVVYTNTEAVGFYCDREMATLVMVAASDVGEAEHLAEEVMVANEMNIEDIWYMERIDEISDIEEYINEYSFDIVYQG